MKKGFTLIELLAVIVILAVIAVIAIPIIMNIIEDARKNSAIQSANGYVRAVNYKIAQEILNEREVDEEIDYVIGENELSVTGNNLDGIIGSYSLSNSRVLWAGLCVNGYSVEYNAATGYTGISSRNFCGEEEYVYDFAEEKNYQSIDALCTGSSVDSIYSSTTNYKIEKIEDLVCLSNLVNGGKNFSGKTIYLIEDLDFSSDNSYNNPATTAYGDINGNNTIEALKTELTTGSGFKPIGNISNKFNGTFLGYARTISNLIINRNIQYVGLFGYNSGTIRGIKLRNINVTGGSNATGGLAGYSSSGSISSIDVEGTVIGSTTGGGTGGVVGYGYYGNVKSSMFKGIVIGYKAAGILADASSITVSGVTHDATITGYSSNVASGYGYSAEGSTNKNIVSYNTTINKNGATSTNTTITTDYIGLVDGALDTYIGGDNDSDGYYFDYDSAGNITLFSMLATPIENKLKGEGTSNSPYLILDYKDWKMASATIREAKYYSVQSDIDFTNKNFYPLGTSGNKFIGNIDGGMNKISNITLFGISNLGLFEYNNGGTIKGFILDNITINATGTNIGLVAGYNTGTISGIKARNITVSSTSTSSTSYVGGLVGYNYYGTIKNIDLIGNISSNGTYAGGIIGYNYASTPNYTLFRGTVTGANYVAGISGYARYAVQYAMVDGTLIASDAATQVGAISAYYYDGRQNSTIYRSSATTYTAKGSLTQNGSSYTNEASVTNALDTTDSDSDTYYFRICDGKYELFSTSILPVNSDTCVVE